MSDYRRHTEEEPSNDVAADSDVPPGSTEPDPAEVEGDEGEEHDVAGRRFSEPDQWGAQDTLDQRLAEELPDRLGRGEPNPETGELEALESGADDVEVGEPDVEDPVSDQDELPAEEAAIHTQDHI